jgi:flavorubredoxin
MMGAFGSFGWGGGAVKEAYEQFKKMGLETVEPGMQVLYRPSPEDQEKCFEFGKTFAARVKEYQGKFLL